jgi:hypothetical protein
MSIVGVAAQFSPGRIVISPGASLELTKEDVLWGLIRHLSGDWGELDEEDWKENEAALQYGFRLLSRYRVREKVTFWIITEHDRSVTTVLLPDEY